MPDKKNFELNWRPTSYWGPLPLEKHFSSRITGELRRQAVKKAIKEEGKVPKFAEAQLPDTERESAGQVHPWAMGGEYLPGFESNEVEIARVVLNSTMMDVISIRALKKTNRIYYSVRDEYEDEEFVKYSVCPKSSKHPLTLQEIINLIESAMEGGIVGFYRNATYEGTDSAEESFDFATVTSEFYPQLGDWYDQCNEEWLKITELEEEDLESKPLEVNVDDKSNDNEAKKSETDNSVETNLDKPEVSASCVESTKINEEEEFDKEVEDCFKKCRWTTQYYYFPDPKKVGKQIKVFIESYRKQFGKLPNGAHHIFGGGCTEVTFNQSRARKNDEKDERISRHIKKSDYSRPFWNGWANDWRNQKEVCGTVCLGI